MAKVKIYTTPTCVFCLPTKQFLQQQGIDYEEIDISQSEEALKELKEKTGQSGVPVIEVGDRLVIGFDRAKINKLLEEAGLP